MIDININAIISQALAAAVQQAVDAHITALRQEYANKMGEMAERIAALENNPAQGVDTTLEAAQQQTLQSLDNQEWFWDKLRNFTDGAVEQAMEEHTENWDHNDFVTEDKLDDYVRSDDLRDDLRDIMEGSQISLRC